MRLSAIVKKTVAELGDDAGVSGDCYNFAEALRRVAGGEVWCSWDDTRGMTRGSPAHCALKKGEIFWSAQGRGARLREWAEAEGAFTPHREGWAKEDVIIGPVDDRNKVRRIVDNSRISKIEAVLRKYSGSR